MVSPLCWQAACFCCQDWTIRKSLNERKWNPDFLSISPINPPSLLGTEQAVWRLINVCWCRSVPRHPSYATTQLPCLHYTNIPYIYYITTIPPLHNYHTGTLQLPYIHYTLHNYHTVTKQLLWLNHTTIVPPLRNYPTVATKLPYIYKTTIQYLQ